MCHFSWLGLVEGLQTFEEAGLAKDNQAEVQEIETLLEDET